MWSSKLEFYLFTSILLNPVGDSFLSGVNSLLAATSETLIKEPLSGNSLFYSVSLSRVLII